MNHLSLCLLLFISTFATVYAQPETPQQSLNQYVAFLNKSAEVLTRRFQMVQAYQDNVAQYRDKHGSTLDIPSSGLLEAYHYQKALACTGLTAAEK